MPSSHIHKAVSGCLGVIPARWKSSRFPGKPLAMIGGKPMVEHVWRRASEALERVVIATDDLRIADAARSFGAEAIVTPDCANGTERCLMAAVMLGVGDKAVINIQGDEPFVDPSAIASLARESLDRPDAVITAARRIGADENSLIFDPGTVKVVVDENSRALWFSRAPLPWLRDVDTSVWSAEGKHLQHIGMYAFGANIIDRIRDLKPSEAEQVESLEQLRWIAAGIPVLCKIFNEWSLGIDTPEDLELANKICS